MASVPTFLYLGNEAITGGAQPNTQLPVLWGQFLNNYRFSRAKPCGPDGWTAPATNNFAPYWDGNLNGGVGGLTRYHYIDNTAVPPARGDNWFLPAGGGITPCTLLMEGLWDQHPTSPGFRLLKYAKLSAGYASWKPAGAAWTEARAEWDAMVAAMATAGDTPDLKAVILDCSTTDIQAGSATILADALAFVAGIRANYSATCKIVLVTHRADFYTASSLAAEVQSIHRQVRATDSGVSIFDMSWAKFGTDGVIGGTTLGPLQITYETHDYVQAGARLAAHLYAVLTQQTLDTVGGAIETHVFIGDSNMVTAGIDRRLVSLSRQASLLGSDVGGTARTKQWIYDDGTKTVVPYDINGVTTSLGALDLSFGPECTFLKRARERAAARPQNPDVCAWKFAMGGAQFGFLPSAWPTLVAAWKEFKAAVYRDTGRVIDCRSVNIMLGRNDGLSEAGKDLFATTAPTFIDDVRELFTTRADGPELAVTWTQPSPPWSEELPGGTVHGDLAALAGVREIVEDLPNQRPRVAVLLDPDAKRYELSRTDQLHYGAEAVFALGYDMADAVATLNAEDATDADQVGGDDEEELVEAPVVLATPAAIVAMIDQVVLDGGDVASYQTATGQTVTLRGVDQLIRARDYYAALVARQQGVRRTRVMFT